MKSGSSLSLSDNSSLFNWGRACVKSRVLYIDYIPSLTDLRVIIILYCMRSGNYRIRKMIDYLETMIQ